MNYTGKWHQIILRYFQVKWFILIGRFKRVPSSLNFYADMKRNVLVKGLYWKPMEYTNDVEVLVMIDSMRNKEV